ncbi:hypothetical protein TNCV_2651341 [Trichonephila clavipes]|nr:hypothetical protein TNCV_2651341 [Trichonephila clavipes]
MIFLCVREPDVYLVLITLHLYRRFALLRKIFEPWQWKRRKKRNRFEQTSRTLQRKISMRSTKDQLVKKDVLMPVKHNVFLWNLLDVEEVPSHDGETV